MNDVMTNVKRRIDMEVDAIVAGRRGFISERELMRICFDEVVSAECAKLVQLAQQAIYEHPELATKQ